MIGSTIGRTRGLVLDGDKCCGDGVETERSSAAWGKEGDKFLCLGW